MQKIYFVVVGKIKEAFYRDAVAEYVKRLSRFAKVELRALAEGADPEAEAEDILRAVKGYVIALAVEGEKVSSEKLAGKLKALCDEGNYFRDRLLVRAFAARKAGGGLAAVLFRYDFSAPANARDSCGAGLSRVYDQQRFGVS